MMVCNTDTGVRYAPLYLHSFCLRQPHALAAAEQLRLEFPAYGEIETVPDRLRWLRHQRGLMQKEVAELVGVSRSAYIHMETGEAEVYPAGTVDKLAALYQVPVEDLLDDYNRFLYNGQARQLKALREERGWSKKKFAAQMGVGRRCVQKWEREEKQISRKCWDRLRAATTDFS